MADESFGQNALTSEEVAGLVSEALAGFRARGITTAVIVVQIDNDDTDFAMVDHIGSHFTARGLAGHAYDVFRSIPPVADEEVGNG